MYVEGAGILGNYNFISPEQLMSGASAKKEPQMKTPRVAPLVGVSACMLYSALTRSLTCVVRFSNVSASVSPSTLQHSPIFIKK